MTIALSSIYKVAIILVEGTIYIMCLINISDLSTKQIVLIIYISYLVLLSIITFFLYLADKKKAKKGKWRIPEKVLLLCSLFGGAYLGFPAMLIFRHKTKGEHWYFTFFNLLGLIIHTALIILIIFVFHF